MLDWIHRVIMWLVTPRTPKRQVAETLSGPADAMQLSGPPEPIGVACQQHSTRYDLCLQGYAPIIAITKNRRYCEYCGERVYRGVRHVCWGNVEYHIDTLTTEECARILAQLASRPRKLTSRQLRKLYASDGKGPLEHEHTLH